MNPVDLLENPRSIGQCEYRVIYEALHDTLEDCPEGERMDLAIEMLSEFRSWADHIKRKLKKAKAGIP